MRVLLDERYAPVTSGFTLLKPLTPQPPKDLAQRMITKHLFKGVPDIAVATGDFESKIQQLISPGLSDRPNRFLAIPVNGWTVLFSNNTSCARRSLMPLFGSSDEHAAGIISITHSPHITAKRNAPRDGRWGGLEFDYYAPETRTDQHILRRVNIQLHDEGWVVDERGDRLPGECDEQWDKRQKKDRFTSETIHQVCLNFGLDIYNPDTYAADGVILQYGEPRRNDMKPGYWTLQEVQDSRRIVPGIASKIPEGKPKPQPITGPPIPKPLIPAQPNEAFDRLPETTEPGAHLERWTATIEGETVTCWAAWTDLPTSDHPACTGDSPVLNEPPFSLKPGTLRENLFAPESLISDYTCEDHGDQTYRHYRISDTKEDLEHLLGEWMTDLTAQRDQQRRTQLADVPYRFMRFVRIMHETKESPWHEYSRAVEEEFATEYNLELADDSSQHGLWEDGTYWVLRLPCPTGCGVDLFVDMERPDPLEMRYKIVPTVLEPWWTNDTPSVPTSSSDEPDARQPSDVFSQLPEGIEPGIHLEPWTGVVAGKEVSAFAGWVDRPSPECPACEAQPAGWPVILPRPPFTVEAGTAAEDIYNPDCLITPFTCPECDANMYDHCQLFASEETAAEELELFVEELSEARTVIRDDKLQDLPKQFDTFLQGLEGHCPSTPSSADDTCVSAARDAGLDLADDADGSGLWFDGQHWVLTVDCPTGSGAQLYVDTYRPGNVVPDYKIKPIT